MKEAATDKLGSLGMSLCSHAYKIRWKVNYTFIISCPEYNVFKYILISEITQIYHPKNNKKINT